LVERKGASVCCESRLILKKIAKDRREPITIPFKGFNKYDRIDML